MLKRAVIILLVLVSICGALPTLHAQPGDAPILILADNVLWKWADDSLTPFTDQTNVWYVEMSPDGTQLAVQVWSPITIDAMNRKGRYVAAPGPTDIWVIDIATGQQTLVAEQPPDASYYADEDTPNKAIYRSSPTWSPDGTHLAWTEADTGEHKPSRLIVADLNTQTQRPIVARLPDSCAVINSPEVNWGPGGLAVELYTCNVDCAPGWRIQLYDTTGALLQEFAYPNDDRNQMTGCEWVTYQSQDYVGVFFGRDRWDMLDPRTGERLTVYAPPEVYSTSNPDQSAGLAFYQEVVTVDNDSHMEYRWTAAYPGQPPEELSESSARARAVAIGPDGQRIAYLTDDGDLVIWQNGESHLLLSGSEAGFERWARVFWGATGIRVAPGQVPELVPFNLQG